MLKCRFLGPQEVWNKVSAFPYARDDSDTGHIWPTLRNNDLEVQSHNCEKLYRKLKFSLSKNIYCQAPYEALNYVFWVKFITE